jgi:hypothetical protein
MNYHMQTKDVIINDETFVSHGDIWAISETENMVVLVLVECDHPDAVNIVIASKWDGRYEDIVNITTNKHLIMQAINLEA